MNLGVIEGYFGRSWSFDDRHAMAGFLKQNGYSFYIYAPKNDPYLRRNWQEDWPDEERLALYDLASHYQLNGLNFGVGLSPFELFRHVDSKGLKSLDLKVKSLNQMNCNILCILFDDMRGDFLNLAKIQVDIVHRVAEASSADRIIICPTYYTDDPVLDRVFGQRPHDYLDELGEALDHKIDVFWTGPQVCSNEYPHEHLLKVADALKRKPFLWDNYPVNDGAKKSEFLHLMPFKNRNGQLASFTNGHAVNPMNQSWLSRIPLYTLPICYQKNRSVSSGKLLSEACKSVCTGVTGRYILDDVETFHNRGLSNISIEEKEDLIRKYSGIKDCKFASEIVDWLNGHYVFDPACLTD